MSESDTENTDSTAQNISESNVTSYMTYREDVMLRSQSIRCD